MTNYQRHINQANYTAIKVLEQIELHSPSQKQIDVIESLILIAMRPKLLNLASIEKCISSDNIAKRVLHGYLKRALRKK